MAIATLSPGAGTALALPVPKTTLGATPIRRGMSR